MIEKQEWLEWKSAKGWQEFELEMQQTILELTQKLVLAKESNPEQDMWNRGAIWALTQLHEFLPEFIETNMEEELND